MYSEATGFPSHSLADKVSFHPHNPRLTLVGSQWNVQCDTFNLKVLSINPEGFS